MIANGAPSAYADGGDVATAGRRGPIQLVVMLSSA
jgi:hypothetical protein